MQNSFLIYADYEKHFNRLDDTQRGKLIMAIFIASLIMLESNSQHQEIVYLSALFRRENNIGLEIMVIMLPLKLFSKRKYTKMRMIYTLKSIKFKI